MKNEEINNIISQFISDNLTPIEKDRLYIKNKSEQLKGLLKQNADEDLFRSGSFARFTAIKPVKDLDIIWPIPESVLSRYNKTVIKGKIDPEELYVEDILNELSTNLQKEFNKIGERVKVSSQTHSATIRYLDSSTGFAIDLVPAINSGIKNDYGDTFYKVPEILEMSSPRRIRKYEESMINKVKIQWILSDPKGYKQQSIELNEANPFYRKTTKFLKGWKAVIKKTYPDLPMKSFHLEQIAAKVYSENIELNLYDGLIQIFSTFESYFKSPQIKDRADNGKYIDDYVARITDAQWSVMIKKISEAFVGLQEFKKSQTSSDIISILESLLIDNSKSTYPSPSSNNSRIVKPAGIWRNM